MKARSILYKLSSQPFRGVFAIFCVATLTSSLSVSFGQEPASTPPPTSTNTATPQEAWKLPADQLDSLVAPIALYADPLLSQTLVASTYPLEIIQLQQWLGRNKSLKGKALSEAVQKQNWDPSVQAMVAVPDVVDRLAGNIQWTTELGNAFLAQPDDVMNSVQRMRTKAQGTGALVTTGEQKVEKQTVEGGKEVIVIEQAKPEVIYVPSYDPVVVYGAPVYPYPSYVYPGYVPGAGLAFGAGLILGAAWGNGWGYHCGWGSGNVNINYNNNYINHYNKVNNIGNVNGGRWQHQPGHRGGTPYGPGGIGGVGGGTRPGGVGGIGGVGGAGRPGGVGGVGGVGGAGRPGGVGGVGGIGGAGGAGRPGGVGSIGGAGGAGRPGGAGSIGGAGGAGRPGGAGSIGGAGGAGRPSTLPATRPSGGNSIGNRSVSSGSGYGSSRSAFGGSSSGSSARASSSRGSSSMRSSGGGSRGGGGGSRGGGGGSRGGGRR